MRWAFLFAFALVSACNVIDGLTSHDCATIAIPGLSVSVVDSLSGTPVASGATVRATDGTLVDSASFPANRPDLDSLGVSLAYERAGTYQVSVTRSGYRTWTQSNVRVRKGDCHVETVRLTARLVRAP